MGRLSPVVLSQQSRKFLEASEREFSCAGYAMSIPGYFLSGRALELSIKSFLLVKGFSEQQLKKIGHNLDTAVDTACGVGLNDSLHLENVDRAVIFNLNQYYVTKDLEYTKTGYKSYPDPNVLLGIIRRVLDGIDPVVRSWRPDE